MINIKEINSSAIKQKNKYTLSKTLRILSMSGLILLSACSKPPVVEPPKPDPEPIDYTQIETVDPRVLYDVTPKQLKIDGKIVDYETVKNEVEYPFFYEVLTKEEIEYRYKESINRTLKAWAISDNNKATYPEVDSFGNVYSQEEISNGTVDKVFSGIASLSATIFNEMYKDPAFSSYRDLFTQSENKDYALNYDFSKPGDDLRKKELFIRYVYTLKILYFKLLEENGIEYNPIAAIDNFVYTMHI